MRIEFNCDQYTLSQLMITPGLVSAFSRMERYQPHKQGFHPNSEYNTTTVVEEEESLLLQAALKQRKISYSLIMEFPKF